MDNEHGELTLELETLPDTDSEELAALVHPHGAGLSGKRWI
jgi:hypothetical protein